MLYTVLMAGGSGTRLWPLSRASNPKHVLSLAGGESLFQTTLARMSVLAPPERTFIVTTEEQVDVLAAQASLVPADNIIAEPVGRDSAAAVILSAAVISQLDPSAVILVAPADHMISPADVFRDTAARAANVAGDAGMLVTFGIKPRFAATGYGYIERGEPLQGYANVWRVRKFHEKPNAAIAADYVRRGGIYWNSGLFAWRASAILDAASTLAPRHYEALMPVGELFGDEAFAPALAAAYESLPRISIDYAVMEKAPNVAVIEAPFQWDDVGSTVALRSCSPLDESGNVRIGLIQLLESSGCVVVSTEDHLTAVLGCEDMVIVHTGDATLVCPAARAQDVKNLVARLHERGDLESFL